MPNAVRSDEKPEEYFAALPACTVHSDGTLGVFELKTRAEELIATVEAYLEEVRGIDAASKNLLEADIQQLRFVLSGYEDSKIEPLVDTLSRDYAAVSDTYPRPGAEG